MKPSKPRGLIRHLGATRRHKALLLIPGIVLASAIFIALRQVPDQFESSAVVAIKARPERLAPDERKSVAIQQQLADEENGEGR